MKPDILVITATIFLIGILLSSSGILEGINQASHPPPPSPLQQGIALNN